MTGQARRSAGANSAPVAAATPAKHALSGVQMLPITRTRRWTAGIGAVATAVCVGLLLTASSPVGRSAVAAPAPAAAASVTAMMNRDVDTLSRGSINREALASSEDDSALAADASAAPTVFYVVGSVYLRDQPSATAKVVTTLAAGTQVTANGDAANGWQPVTEGSMGGYVKSSLLTATAPTQKVSSNAGAAASSYPACASGSAVEAGLMANAILVHRAVCATFPDITAYGGIRGDGSEHATGKAVDIMTSGARGLEIAAWLQANCSKLGIVEIIYQQRIWTAQRSSEGWRAMPDRGSVTANHFDHIHVLVV